MQQQLCQESGKRKTQRRGSEYQSAPKGGKVAIHCVFPMFRGSGGPTSRLAKAGMRGAKLHAALAQIKVPIRLSKAPQAWSAFGTDQNLHAAVTKHVATSKCYKSTTLRRLLDVQASLYVAGAMGSAPCQK